MLKKLVLLSGLLLTSLSAQATLISHFGYERDSASDIVIGGGLEWLKWDVTKGMSINSALSAYASLGWRLASNDEMASLFNSFEFGKTDWHANESISQIQYIPWDSAEELSSHAMFISLFGFTSQLSCSIVNRATMCYSDDEPLLSALAFFGADQNNNGLYNFATVQDDSILVLADGSIQFNSHMARISSDSQSVSLSSSGLGVALVRNSVPDIVAVPTPGSIGLLALGLVALGYRRRQVLGR